jgi:hypothetical protein
MMRPIVGEDSYIIDVDISFFERSKEIFHCFFEQDRVIDNPIVNRQ